MYLNGVAYYRSGSESKVMSATIEEELRNRKYLLRSGMADKIDAARRAINSGHTICLVGYDSSNSNTSDKDRKVEAFAFTDNKRCDSLWAFDPKDRKNKVFHLRRADVVKVLDERWKYAKLHKTYELDIFGFSGNENIPFDIVLKTTRGRTSSLIKIRRLWDIFRKWKAVAGGSRLFCSIPFLWMPPAVSIWAFRMRWTSARLKNLRKRSQRDWIELWPECKVKIH